MNYSISIVFATLFFVLSAAMFVVLIPQKKEYEHYKKSRFSLGTAFFLLGLIGLLENDLVSSTLDDYIKFSFMSMICLTFTALNYLSFFYISETAQVRLKTVIKSVLLGGVLITLFSLIGYKLERYQFIFQIVISFVHISTSIFLFIHSLREYKKCKHLIDNYYSDHMWDVKWMKKMLWITLFLAFILILSIWIPETSNVLELLLMIFYTYLTFKVLNFVPSTIDRVRHKISLAKTEEEEKKIENADVPSPKKLSEYSKKIAPLLEDWVASEHYTKPTLTIRDVASEMGTNHNYLSTYLNKELNLSFTTWLNTLRIEKSKELLCSCEKCSIEECGRRVGIPEIYNYSRWFKTVTGMSPAAYRKNFCKIK